MFYKISLAIAAVGTIWSFYIAFTGQHFGTTVPADVHAIAWIVAILGTLILGLGHTGFKKQAK